MSTYIHVCNTCGHKSTDGPAVLEHRQATGHIGSRLRFARPDAGGELPRLFRSEVES